MSMSSAANKKCKTSSSADSTAGLFWNLRQNGIDPLTRIVKENNYTWLQAPNTRNRLKDCILVINQGLSDIQERIKQQEELYVVLGREYDKDIETVQTLRDQNQTLQQTLQDVQNQVATHVSRFNESQEKLQAVLQENQHLRGMLMKSSPTAPKPLVPVISFGSSTTGATQQQQGQQQGQQQDTNHGDKKKDALIYKQQVNIAALKRDVVAERAQSARLLAQFHQATTLAAGLPPPPPPPPHPQRGNKHIVNNDDNITQVLKITSERDAERHENFFLRRQLAQLQNRRGHDKKLTTTSHAKGSNRLLDTTNHDAKKNRLGNTNTTHTTTTTTETTTLVQLPTKKHIVLQQRLEELQRAHAAVTEQQTTWEQSLAAAHHENGQLRQAMRNAMSLLAETLVHNKPNKDNNKESQEPTMMDITVNGGSTWPK